MMSYSIVGILLCIVKLSLADQFNEESETLQPTSVPFWGLMDHFHGLNSIGSWYLDKYMLDIPTESGKASYLPSTPKSIDGKQDLVKHYHKRKSHRDQIKSQEDWEQIPLIASQPLHKRDINYLEDSVPLQQSIAFGKILSYEFDTNIKSQWANGYESLVFITASICTLPDDWDTDASYNGLNIYFTYNVTLANDQSFGSMSKAQFQNGYAEGLAEIDAFGNDFENENSTDYDTLYLFVIPDECSFCTEYSHWQFGIGVSETNILFLYDNDPILSVIDVDYDSGIFDASEVSFSANRTFELFVFNSTTNPLPVALNQSWCAIHEISQGEGFSQWVELNSTTVNNDTHVIPVTNLEIDTKYHAVLVINHKDQSFGGGIFQSFSFTTADNMACKLIYNLEFCNAVAYAVPNSANFTDGSETWDEISKRYDDNAKSYFEPFLFALQQTACDTELDSRYSPLVTCNDCEYSYKQWLCAVTIPRCDNSASDNNQHKIYPAGKGRTEFIEEIIIPPMEYSEIQPCLNNCHAIVRDCPPEFAFGCPEKPEIIKRSYGDISLDVNGTDNHNQICNYVGKTNSQLVNSGK